MFTEILACNFRVKIYLVDLSSTKKALEYIKHLVYWIKTFPIENVTQHKTVCLLLFSGLYQIVKFQEFIGFLLENVAFIEG